MEGKGNDNFHFHKRSKGTDPLRPTKTRHLGLESEEQDDSLLPKRVTRSDPLGVGVDKPPRKWTEGQECKMRDTVKVCYWGPIGVLEL